MPMIPDTMSMTTEEMLRVLQSTPPSVTHSQVPLLARVPTPAFGTTDGQVRTPISLQGFPGTWRVEDAALIPGPPANREHSGVVTMTSGVVDEGAVAPQRALIGVPAVAQRLCEEPQVKELPRREALTQRVEMEVHADDQGDEEMKKSRASHGEQVVHPKITKRVTFTDVEVPAWRAAAEAEATRLLS